ncbi:MAG: hypothetical protein ABR923_22875 [Terracidiphilus sp.]|jgi:hypothetical protein
MNLPILSIIARDSSFDWYVIPFIIAFAVISIASRYWKFVAQWLDGIRGREWARVSAVIDVVSVVKQTEQTRYGERVIGYEATLTYFYRNPELQMGEYSRMFDEEGEAQAWAASYKARSVMVHVDPRDGAKSVLRKEEL